MINPLRWFKREKCTPKQSNVIQYCHMGYPLRLLIGNDGKQYWRDTYEREGDVVLKWGEVKEEGTEE